MMKLASETGFLRGVEPLSFIEHDFYSLNLPQRIAVGWSGGADSTVLLLTLKNLGHQVVAWHIDHGWHCDSAKQAESLRQQADAWNVPFHVATLVQKNSNREAEARSARYNQFQCWADEQGLYDLALGHHMDDQAESVCLRMLQGAGISGCCGMLSRRKIGGLTLFRPLLHVSRRDIELILKEKGVDWLQDPSNLDTTLLRNRVRHLLFPAMQRSDMEPKRLYIRWQQCADRLHKQISTLADSITITECSTGVSVRWQPWQSQPMPIRVMILQRMMAKLLGEGTVAGKRHIQLIEVWRTQGARNGLDLSRSRLWRKGKDLNLSESKLTFRHHA
ncbi:MAG: tRNA lysidine(34) synthetase TilS [Mariprofundaceae bacterium]